MSVYDASYIALAEIVGTNSVTADEKLYRKLHGKNRSSFSVHWAANGTYLDHPKMEDIGQAKLIGCPYHPQHYPSLG